MRNVPTIRRQYRPSMTELGPRPADRIALIKWLFAVMRAPDANIETRNAACIEYRALEKAENHPQREAASAMLAALEAVQGCPQAMTWLARLPMDNSIMSVADVVAIALERAKAAGITTEG